MARGGHLRQRSSRTRSIGAAPAEPLRRHLAPTAVRPRRAHPFSLGQHQPGDAVFLCGYRDAMTLHPPSVNEVGADWFETSRRNARSVQTIIGWIFWDPGAVARYGEELGFPGPLGYIASRCAPLAAAGADAVVASFGSISSLGIRMVFDLLEGPQDFWKSGRRETVRSRRVAYAPEIVRPLEEMSDALWAVVEKLPVTGRVRMFGSLLAVPRPGSSLLAGWHAVNCLREWRGDTHWAIIVSACRPDPFGSFHPAQRLAWIRRRLVESIAWEHRRRDRAGLGGAEGERALLMDGRFCQTGSNSAMRSKTALTF